MTTPDPFVSILTPLYNGEDFLVDCIESILAQTYQNWEYTIVNNCSTDKSLEIAQQYAAKDKRIKVVNNSRFVGVIENYNTAFCNVSPQSKYCKVVAADDWIYPECLSKMVKLAERHPSAGIVGSYQLADDEVHWQGLPLDIECLSGRDVCRQNLLGQLYIFGNPTSTLYRSDLILKNIPFFPSLLPHADRCACYKYLQNNDYGFVHEILSVERIHHHQVSAKAIDLGMFRLGDLDMLLQYGPIYLSGNEYEIHKKYTLETYWRWLGGCLLKMKGKEFWRFQAATLSEFGYPLPWGKLLKGAADEFIDKMGNPKNALKKFIVRFKERILD